VEVNVTEAGTYQLSVGGLEGETGGNNKTSDIFYDGRPFDDYLDIGVHIINFTFLGSKIVYYHLDPVNVTHLNLSDYYHGELSYIETIALSKKYNHTQFNYPLNEMKIAFTVYPNATLNIKGSSNNTHAYPSYHDSPLMNASIGFLTNGDSTTGSVNGTMVVPEFLRNQFPSNSTVAHHFSEYYQGIINNQLDVTISMPSDAENIYPLNSSDFSFLAAYSDGLMNTHIWGETVLPDFYASQFPFNISDATVFAEYDNKEINGNITFHALSGFPLGDIIVHFKGNTTEISFTGYINVIYGNYSGMVINSTSLEDMLTEFNSTLPGRGENSLYNMTEGTIECTALNTTNTPIAVLPGARVDYNATIIGNFTLLLVQAMNLSQSSGLDESTVYAALDSTLSSVQNASLTMYYYYASKIASFDLNFNVNVNSFWADALQSIPPTVPIENRTQIEAFLKIANITAEGIMNADVNASYSSNHQKLDIHAMLIANITQIENEILPILPDTVPQEFQDLLRSCTNTTYCKLDAFNTTWNYANGILNFEAEWYLEGDFKSELNRIKNCYIKYLNSTSPLEIDWQVRLLNATLIDINNFKTDIRQNEEWMMLSFEGLRINTVKDEADPIRFKLFRLFNMTAEPSESPREFEKLMIILTSGFNGTHTVLLKAPRTVPNPDITSLDYKTMTWENMTVSSLKDMLFKIAYQEAISHLGQTYYIPIFTNSTVNDFRFTPTAKRISFNVTGLKGMGFCNMTIPKTLLYADPEWTVRIDGNLLVPEEFLTTENAEYTFIYLNYSHSTHLVEIEGTWIISEFPPYVAPLIILAVSLIAAIVVVKKLSTLKNHQHMVKIFTRMISRLHPQNV
jgi:hypothetical protein